MLITVGTADTQVHIPSSELLYNSATSTRDKTVFYVDGAEHNMVEIDGKYGNTRKIAIQQVAEWIKQRFPVAS